MTKLVADPLAGIGLVEFGRRLRRGDTSSAAAVEAYLARIAQLDGRLGAYEHVAADSARVQAAALDRLLAAGVDLGPLMGVPVAVKDLFAIDGMPLTIGSAADLADLVGPEGSFVRALRRAGCVILGKTKTVEMALGAIGVNRVRGTPWNPSDAEIQRIPGGSSSGSAVAVAAGLCAFAIGTDTGGSVRVPAAFCGIVGLKTTFGLWPLDGVFPLSRTLDTIGLLTRTAEDAAVAFAALAQPAVPATLAGLRLGKPTGYFYDDLEPDVATAMAAALARLAAAGAAITEIEVPEAAERRPLSTALIPGELIATLGRERFLAERGRMDPVVAGRAAQGLELPAEAYIRALWRQRQLVGIAAARMAGLDAWVTPSAPALPMPVAEFAPDSADAQRGVERAIATTQMSQPVNLFGQCAVSLPIHHLGARLPVGLQLVGAAHGDARLLGVAMAAAAVLGAPPSPDLAAFAKD